MIDLLPSRAARSSAAALFHPQPRALFRRRWVAAAALLAAVAGPPAGAQSPSAERTRFADAADDAGNVILLGEFEVRSDVAASSALPTRPLTSIYGLPVTVLDTPRAITQVSADELKYDNFDNTADFVKYSASVNFNAEKNNSRGPSVRGAFGDIYQNGFWLAPGVRPLQQTAYESLDIVAGPAGAVFGPTQRTSSYINYTTKAADFSKRSTEISLNLGRWVAGGGSYSNFVQQIDTTAPLIPGKLAYRVSAVNAGPDTYYEGIKSEYYTLFATLAWRPTHRVTVDWNAQFGVYDYQDVRGWNRVTQDLVDHGNYLTGTAVPIVRGGPTGFYSAVVDAAGNVTGFVTRTRQTDGKYIAGAAYTPAATATSANTVVGWVLDPTGVRKIEPYQGENSPSEDFNDTKEFITQFRVRVALSDNASLFNGTNYQHYETRVNGTGMFVYGYTGDYAENRTELQTSHERSWLGARVRHSTNSGVSFRFSQVDNVSGNPGAFWSSPIDILGTAKHSVNGLFGTTVIDPAVGLGNLGGAVSTKFGSIWFPSSYPTKYDGVYTTAGVVNSNVALSRQFHSALFTQHLFDFNSRWNLNLGARLTNIEASIRNLYPNPAVPKSVTDGDSGNYWLPTGSASLSYKPTKGSALYVTYGYSEAVNGPPSQGLLWDTSTGTTQPFLGKKNFESVSELYETGAKAELIPDRLIATAAVFHQTRVAPIQTINGVGQDSARLRVRGVELALRYEPTKAFSAGVNYSYTDAIYLNYLANVQSPYGFVADNATPFATSSAGVIPVGNYRLTAVPKNAASTFAGYRWANGFGVKVSGWWQERSLYKIAYPVWIPSQYNVDVAVSYRRPKWYAQIDFLNVTDRINFANVGVDSVDFLQVLPRFGIQGKVSFRF